MENHEQLLLWAEAQGIEMNGIRPDRIPGRGIGIITMRKIKENELLLKVPTKALRTLFTVPKSVSSKLPATMTVHGLLAADMALDESGKFDEWNSVQPTPKDLETVPLTWPSELQEYLPLRARELLRKQEVKFAKDWACVSAAFPTVDRDDYLHTWLLANTRTFYFVCPRTEKLAREDRMVLQPVADLFNHADLGCAVAFSDDEFTVRSDRAYAAGEEIFICYGQHSNDFLLAEYGFVLDEGRNRFDEVCIDDAILPRLTAPQKALLEEYDYLGNYMLDSETVCFRTKVAVRVLSSQSQSDWLDFVEGVNDDDNDPKEQRQQVLADRHLLAILTKYRRQVVQKSIGELEVIQQQRLTAKKGKGKKGTKKGAADDGLGNEIQLALIITRWKQIDGLVSAAIERFDV